MRTAEDKENLYYIFCAPNLIRLHTVNRVIKLHETAIEKPHAIIRPSYIDP